MFALVDCNNFYCSCERVFDPSLRRRPVAVLSNNDGIIIARSNEVKAMGIAMGTPYFKAREDLARRNVAVFSSNYTLYADMSRRVMATLAEFTPDLEIYSIDAAFPSLDPLGGEGLAQLGREIRRRVGRWTGIPVSVGIAPTKTLAKVANHYAKKHPETGGVFMLASADSSTAREVLEWTAVTDVWGIGRRWGAKLIGKGIRTAADFARMSDSQVQSTMNVLARQTAMELRGQPCMELEQQAPPAKTIVRSRSFGKLATGLDEICQAVSTYTEWAAARLRKNHQLASLLQVYMHTNRHSKTACQYSPSALHAFIEPTCDAAELVTAGAALARRIYRPGYSYKKAGVMLSGLELAANHMGSLFADHDKSKRSADRLATIDRINARYGKDTLHLASSGLKKTWSMNRGHLSPRYTTSWSELKRV